MMFMWRLVVLGALVAASGSGSQANSRRDDIKGGRLQADTLQSSGLKSPKFEAQIVQSEQREEPLTQQHLAQQQLEQEPVSQIKEEAVKIEEPKKYEARPQVIREEIKGPARAEEKIEQFVQQRADYDGQQQVELREGGEQRKLEDNSAAADYQQRAESDKGLAAAAPAGQAEPYAFSYQVEGSSRSESGDANGVVKGQYTIQGTDGPSRVVDYVADHNGFRASVSTNEFGTESKSAASVALRTSQPTAEEITLRQEGKTKIVQQEAPLALGSVKGAPLPVQRIESPAIKAPPAAPLLPLPLPAQVPIKTEEEIPRAPTKRLFEENKAAPAKGQQRFAQQEEQHQTELASAEQPAKGAQLRGPKSLSYAASSEPRVFESATAHRVYRGPALAPVAVRPAPAVVVRREPAPSQVVRVAPVRGHVHRYPPSPVLGYRRQHVAHLEPVVGVNPRVSFYGPASSAGFEDELPAFEHADARV